MFISISRIIKITFLVEGWLLLVALLWAFLRDIVLPVSVNISSILIGLGYALGMLVVNAVLFNRKTRKLGWFKSSFEFRDTIVIPLALELRTLDIVVISLCAGVAEETFFRGVLEQESGLIVSNLVFSVVHFGPALTRFPFLVFIYFLAGCALSVSYLSTENLAVPVIAHIVFDLIMLFALRQTGQSTITT